MVAIYHRGAVLGKKGEHKMTLLSTKMSGHFGPQVLVLCALEVLAVVHSTVMIKIHESDLLSGWNSGNKLQGSKSDQKPLANLLATNFTVHPKYNLGQAPQP